ncbi:hypothetical protein QYE76_049335 [Lolium multiflorum]|uniref:DUF4220 domain-containing protein n=1 Tax=Lolium multiflorum TaxID=4521 RepID=A0AAD8SPS8_LOLMU|nr:hypothetical protein QYE76_049335 [Lolium multiflorum]
MDVSGAVQWWEEWQLRILVLASVMNQVILLLASFFRKLPIRPSWFRQFVIWQAYLSSEAIPIYALATLFNRQKKHSGHSVLEVLWAPVLLIHLGGQDGIPAYNIEDNELWTRHLLTSVSQVTVAVYVFCKSWPGDDKRLLQAAILLFIPGILKCFQKPWALSRASINSLVSSDEPILRSIDTSELKIDPLEDFIDKATSPAGPNDTPATPVDFAPYKLFVDLPSPSPGDRMKMLLSFAALNDSSAHIKLQFWLRQTFLLLYTKEKMSGRHGIDVDEDPSFQTMISVLVRALAICLPFAAIALFHQSHREAYSKQDVVVTFILLSCTAVLELYIIFVHILTKYSENLLPGLVVVNSLVSQYNLIGLLIRNKEHSKMMAILGFFGCTDFLQQRWPMKSCRSSFKITKAVFKYVKSGWHHHICDVSTYRKFNDNRGQSTLERQGCYQELGWSLEGAFDESVLLWHLATDFCYYIDTGASPSQCTQDSCPGVYACPAWCRGSEHHEGAVQCREMSNYMMYLLYVNPEMLMAGTRRNLFTAAYDELMGIITVGDNKSPVEERDLTQRIIFAVDGGGSPPPDGTQRQQGAITHLAWSIAKVLSGLPEEKMWNVIEGVWVEMMCFSAARCRGYLHAKGLATGVEYLTCVWLLQYYMGMETLAAKLQKVDHHRKGVAHGDDPLTSHATGPSGSSGAQAEGQSAGYRASEDPMEEIL